MIRALRAIVWLRWRLLLNGLKGASRRDSMEQVSRAMTILVPFAFAALSLGTVVAVAVIAYLGGHAIATGLIEPIMGVFVARLTVVAVLALVIVITIVAPGQTAMARYSRLLILPIPRQALHVTEVVANLVDPWIGFVIPGLMLFGIGLAVGGRSGPALVAVVAGILLLAVLAALGALISSLVGWLVRSRRRGELLRSCSCWRSRCFRFCRRCCRSGSTIVNATRPAGA
jgi:hypothetical protein